MSCPFWISHLAEDSEYRLEGILSHPPWQQTCSLPTHPAGHFPLPKSSALALCHPSSFPSWNDRRSLSDCPPTGLHCPTASHSEDGPLPHRRAAGNLGPPRANWSLLDIHQQPHCPARKHQNTRALAGTLWLRRYPTGLWQALSWQGRLPVNRK